MSPPKKTEPKNPAAAMRAAMVAKAKAAIQKTTKQKPLQPGVEARGYVSTGSFATDMLIGGTANAQGQPICPGYPRRAITELYGPESSGKTTMLIHAMVEAQKAGGAAMFIDFEHALDHSYAKALGLSYDEDKLLVYQPDTMEEGFNMMYVGVASGFDIIGVDSVAAMVPKAEMAKGFDAEARVGGVARPLSGALPKFQTWLHQYPKVPGDKDKVNLEHPGTAIIFVNQTRALIGGMSHENETTSGGKALKFYSFLRIRVSRIKSESVEKKDPMTGKKRRFPYGNVTNVKIVKSKLDAKQGHSCSIFIRYGAGIDDYFSMIETGVAQKVIKKEGSYYALGDQRFQGKEKFRAFLRENPKVYEALKQKLAKLIIESAIDGPVQVGDDDEILEGGFDLDDGSDTDELESIEEEVNEAMESVNEAN
jgi:recombination protein RecA